MNNNNNSPKYNIFEESHNTIGIFSSDDIRLKKICEHNKMLKFEKCEICSGSGIVDYIKEGKVSGTTFCENCASVGGRIVIVESGLYEQCKICSGTGNILHLGNVRKCKNCNGNGFLDWLDTVIGNKNNNDVTKNKSFSNFLVEQHLCYNYIPSFKSSDIGRNISVKGTKYLGTPHGWRKVSNGDNK